MNQKENLYQAPESGIQQEQPVFGVNNRPGRLLRLGTFLIDYFMMLVLTMLVFMVAYMSFDEASVDRAIDSFPDFVFGALLFLIYYVPQETLFGRTIGKLICGTRVVDMEGKPITFMTASGRTLCRLIPFEAFSFLGPTARGWHDSIPKTMVIRTRGLAPDDLSNIDSVQGHQAAAILNASSEESNAR